jgi:hypothetical protein
MVGRDSPVDRAFAMREAAISAANTGDWQQATAWFDEAQKAATKLESEDMQAMAVGLEADTAVAALKAGNTQDALRKMAGCLVNLAKLKPDISLRTAYCHRVVRHTVLWMDSQLDERETLIDGKPIVMLPGTCSNPDPPASIAELPLGPLDMAWYMLAEAEVSSGYDVNIASSLRKRLSNGPIIFLEVSLRTRRISVSIKESDSASFSLHLADYLAAMEYMRTEGKKLRESFDVMTPQRGEIPSLPSGRFTEATITGVAEDAMLGFVMSALFREAADPTAALGASLSRSLGEQFPGKTVVDALQGNDASLGQLEQAVVRAIKAFRSDAHIEPRLAWEMGLRFFEKSRRSNFRGPLLSMLAAWLRRQWQQIIAEETFRLSRPMQTVPGIKAILAKAQDDEPFVAELLLSTSEAVGSPLGASYENLLKKIAQRKIQASAESTTHS